MIISNFAYSQVGKPQHDPPETINRYAAVLAFDICTNTITVSDATEFNTGDTVLMIQMKGAIIDTSNSPSFGNILDYGNAGNYEFNFISAKSGNQLTFLNRITRNYDIPDGVVQLVRVPKYKAVNFSGGLVPLSWNGATGGIICVYATNSITSGESFDASGRGFRGAAGYNASSTTCNQNDYYYPSGSQYAAFKGESIGSVSQNMVKGKGNVAGGGGGGNSHNSGGGGGGNGGSGGQGGYQSDSCNAAAFNNGGIGGKSLAYNSAINKIFMGSGGGAGHVDNADFNPAGGGNGGGIIIVITDVLEMNGEPISSNGDFGASCASANCNDGSAGGGAGGTILLNINQASNIFNVEANGGRGANMTGAIVPGGRSGPGGGGGGGVLFNNGNTLPANVTFDALGGLNGVVSQDAGNSWGAMPGNSGVNLFDLVLPWDNVPFKPNIDSVRFQSSVNYCNNIQFSGSGYTNTFPVAAWHWDFGDGGSSSTQNPVHNYSAVGNYDVKLVVTDINGCKDSITININTAGIMTADAGADAAFCVDGYVSVPLSGSGTGNSFSWTPAAVLNNSSLPNPVATIDTTTKFYLTVSNGTGCSKADSVTITINKNPIVKTLKDTVICQNAPLVLTTTGAANYSWSPAAYVSNPVSANPQYIAPNAQTLYVTGTDANGCIGKDTINVDVKPRTTFSAPEGKTICRGNSVQLTGVNGNAFNYVWSPVAYLSNPLIESPVANPPFTTLYTLKVWDNVCKNDSTFLVPVTVLSAPIVKATKSNDLNCNKPFTQLNASGAATYTWQPAYALSNDSIANPFANPASTTTYYVYGKDTGICAGVDSITVMADFKNHGIILPNSFTPNGDGINDCFGIKYYRDVQDLEFIIFNRYGTAVFKTHNANDCWDGNYKGKPAGAGNYVYYIRGKTLCGYVEIKDNFLLLR